MLMMNGKIVSTSDQIKEMDNEKYKNLGSEIQNNGTTYFVTNKDSADDYRKLVRIHNLLGDETKLQEINIDTIIDAIVDLNQRLGGLSFKRNPETGDVEYEYSPDPEPVEPIHKIEYLTDHDKIVHFEEVLGLDKDKESELNAMGFYTVIAAIKSLYARLGGITMRYDDSHNELKMIYDDSTPK